MIAFERLLVVLLFIFGSSLLSAKEGTAVLKLCFEKDGAPFLVSTKDKKIAEKEGLQQVKETELWMRRMKVLLDGEAVFSFKPVSDHCVAVSRIPSGSHSVAVDFKGAAYTTLVTEGPVTKKFRTGLLYESKMKVSDGATATVEIRQGSDRVMVYQTLDDQPVPACEKGCSVPVDIPLYFMLRSEEEKVECPVQYELVIADRREKGLGCYDPTRIREQLLSFVKENKIQCRVNLEYAFFRVYGEGCLVTMEPDANGLRPKDPEIRLIPLDKQRFQYFLEVTGSDKKKYTFSSTDRKGEVFIPQSGQTIVITEETGR